MARWFGFLLLLASLGVYLTATSDTPPAMPDVPTNPDIFPPPDNPPPPTPTAVPPQS
jgi:hypothetical protein